MSGFIKTFVSNILTFESNIIHNEDGIDKFFRGAASFFKNGIYDTKASETEKEKIKVEIENNSELKAEAYYTLVSQSFNQLTSDIGNTIKLLNKFSKSAKEDLDQIIALERSTNNELSKEKVNLTKLEEELTYIAVNFENWKTQIQSGLIYTNQSLYVRPNNSFIKLAFNNECFLKRNNTDKEITIGIIGGYATGKSTLLNSILGKTLINFAHKNVIVDLYNLNVKLLELSYDTVINDFDLTLELINKTDIILFTSHVGHPLFQDDLELLKLIKMKENSKTIVVMTRKDMIDEEEDLEIIRKYLSSKLEEIAQEATYFIVSVKEALRIRSSIESNLRRTRSVYDSIDETGITELENEINHLLEERSKESGIEPI